MTATLAPSPWPAPARGRDAAGWRFGREVDGALQWVLARNCSITPRQMIGMYLGLCAVSGAISLAFWWVGAPAVAAFVGLELLGLGAALVVFARHAGDRETITLSPHGLAVEHLCGGHVRRASFRAEWVRVEPTAGEGSLVELAGEGRSTCVGRYVHAGQRAELAQELRRALHGLRGAAWR
jgi:uncharacterized membrane protein